jgi:hypothetical protein
LEQVPAPLGVITRIWTSTLSFLKKNQRSSSVRCDLIELSDQWMLLKSEPFVVVKGAELIVAWRRDDLDEFEALRAVPSLKVLQSVWSLTILRADVGDIIYMPRDTVHMVVTEARKIHLAFHMNS